MRKAIFIGALFALTTAGCMMPPQGAALVQQTTQEFNFDTRFGRMELAMEQVSAKYADEFMKRHRHWGSSIHVTDAEGVGMRMRGQDNSDITVRVGWYFADQGELKTTLLKQKWHLYASGWKLDGEERLDGDIGALGEKVEIIAPDSTPRTAQFPTLRLGTD
jgi:hypothetical protein